MNPMSEKQTSSERFEEQDKLINKLCIDLQSRDQSIKQLQSLLAQRDAEIKALKIDNDNYISLRKDNESVSESLNKALIYRAEILAENYKLRKRLEKAEKVIEAADEYIEYFRSENGDCDRYGMHKHLNSMYQREKEAYDSSAALNQDKPKGEG